MTFAQVVLTALASLAVARAFITQGELSYRQRWFNYPIALLAGYLAADLVVVAGLPPAALLFMPAAGAALALAVYQALRMRLLPRQPVGQHS